MTLLAWYSPEIAQDMAPSAGLLCCGTLHRPRVLATAITSIEHVPAEHEIFLGALSDPCEAAYLGPRGDGHPETVRRIIPDRRDLLLASLATTAVSRGPLHADSRPSGIELAFIDFANSASTVRAAVHELYRLLYRQPPEYWSVSEKAAWMAWQTLQYALPFNTLEPELVRFFGSADRTIHTALTDISLIRNVFWNGVNSIDETRRTRCRLELAYLANNFSETDIIPQSPDTEGEICDCVQDLFDRLGARLPAWPQIPLHEPAIRCMWNWLQHLRRLPRPVVYRRRLLNSFLEPPQAMRQPGSRSSTTIVSRPLPAAPVQGVPVSIPLEDLFGHRQRGTPIPEGNQTPAIRRPGGPSSPANVQAARRRQDITAALANNVQLRFDQDELWNTVDDVVPVVDLADNLLFAAINSILHHALAHYQFRVGLHCESLVTAYTWLGQQPLMIMLLRQAFLRDMRFAPSVTHFVREYVQNLPANPWQDPIGERLPNPARRAPKAQGPLRRLLPRHMTRTPEEENPPP